MAKVKRGRRQLSDDEGFVVADAEQEDTARRVAAACEVVRTVAYGASAKRRHTKQSLKSLDLWKGEHRGKNVDALFKGTADRAREKFGHSAVWMGTDTDRLVVCLPIPAFPMEFLLGMDGWPLGLIFQLVSETGVGKTAMLAEIGRWFFLCGGGLELGEAETKFNPRWYEAIFGREVFQNRVPLFRCADIEDWQDMITFAMKDAKKFMTGTAAEPGPGRTIPIVFGVDSVAGKQSRETAEHILGAKLADGTRGKTGQGHAGRGHPIEAQVISRYFRAIPSELDNWPFSCVLINHLRNSKDDRGNDERRKGGGAHLGFQESFEIELRRVGRKRIKCAEWEGYPVDLVVFKNSYAPGERQIRTRLVWWYEDDDNGGFRQRAIWDWDWSTVHLLDTVLSGELNAEPMLRKSLKDSGFHLEIGSRGDIDNTAWSKTLGVSKKKPIPWRDMGRKIRRDKPLLDKLRLALRIDRRPKLAGDYLENLEGLRKNLP